ncbi:MAG: hypothetical protein HOI02_00645 [Rhodospirillaceae bacterium]|nr:hypothetical protein [Rhodospirillaceae bacterium]
MDGGSGNDLLEFFEAAGGATVDLASESVSVDGDGGVDIVLNFENVYGSNYSDDISGDEFDNILSGGTGDDTLFGGDGNDVLDGGDGNDFIDGGDGVDSVSFTSVSSSVYVNLAAGTAIGSEGGVDQIDNMEIVTGSAYGDELIGDSNDNTLYGFYGNDVLEGGAGNDVLDGDDGSDTVSFAGASAGVYVDLVSGSASDGDGGTDILYNIESVLGSNYSDTILTAEGEGYGYVDGGAGDDQIITSGNSTDLYVYGGTGNDTLILSGDEAFEDVFLVNESYGNVLIENVGIYNYTLDVVGVEDLIINTGGGNDTVVIGDLSATDIDSDTVTFDGGTGDDRFFASGEIPANQSFSGAQEYAAITGLTGGDMVVVWTDDDGLDGNYDGIFARIIDSDGAPVGDQFLINSETTTSNQSFADTVALSDGGFVVVWESNDGSGDGVFGQRFDASGSEVGVEFQVNSTSSGSQDGAAVAALSGGGFVVTWESPDSTLDGIFAQRFDVSGTTPTLLGGEITVNTTDNQEVDSAVAGLSSGGFVVTWSTISGGVDKVFGQIFDSGGSTVGGEFQVNTTSNSVFSSPSVSDLPDGGFVVVWTGLDSSGSGVIGQRFDATGTKVGIEFQVNTENASSQFEASVAASSDGTFVVTWTSTGDQDGEDRGIFSQRFDTNSVTTPTAIGSEFGINKFFDRYQEESDVTILGDGGFAVAWQTESVRTNYNFESDIRVSIFDADGNQAPDAATGSLVLDGGDGNDLLIGGMANDVLSGNADDDEIDGFFGDDILFGGDGDDALFGSYGDDTLDGGAGNDIIDGGEGIILFGSTYNYASSSDTVTFSGATSAIDVNLYENAVYDDGQGGVDDIYGIENVIGTVYSDFIYGNHENNSLFGGDGDDQLYGEYGYDMLDGGDGNDFMRGGYHEDILLGGSGDDFLDGEGSADFLDGGFDNDTIYGGSGSDTLIGGDGDDILDGESSSDTLDGGLGNDTLYGGSSIDTLFGGEGDDNLDGGNSNDILDGGIGNDTLYGGTNNDILLDGDGDDILDGGSNDDLIYAGLGNDILYGGDGFDTLTFANTSSDVEVNLSTNTVVFDGFGGTDTVSEIEQVIGGTGNDTLTGSDNDEVLLGGDGNDILDGSGGSDSLDGGAGNDEIDAGILKFIEGGLGDDTFNVSITDSAAIVTDAGGSDTIFLETSTFGLLDTDPTAFLMFIEEGNLIIEGEEFGVFFEDFTTTGVIEAFEFESFGATPFFFASAGTVGNDLLIGVEDTLSLAGGDGNDVIHAGDGDVSLISGGDGNDSIVSSEEFSGTTLDGGIGDDVLRSAGGEGGFNTVLLGGTGNDILIAGGANDQMQGGADDDLYVFDFDGDSLSATISDSGGSDTLLFNSGVDFASSITVSAGDAFLTFAMPSGGISTIDILNQDTSGVEFVQMDIGDGSATTFTVQSVLTGGATNDLIVGDSGIETITGNDGHDMLFGNNGADELLGGAGNDFLQGGTGNDIIDGGADIDTVDVSNAFSGVTVDLNVGGVQTLGGGLGEDTLTSIENVRGSAFSDVIIGDGNDNRIDGGDGDDNISGGGGNDTFVFGSFDGSGIVHFDDSAGSDDTLILGTRGEDAIAMDFWFFKNESDLEIDYEFGGNPAGEQAFVTDQFLSASPVIEKFVFSGNPEVTYIAEDAATSGNDLIVSANSSLDATIIGGDGDDALFGGVANDLLQGDAGNDALIGANGNDVLQGGAGNDDLFGGDGNDSMDGGDGDDVFMVGSGDDTITDSGGVDFIEMASGESLTGAERVGNNLKITTTSESTTTIVNHFAGQAVEFIEEGGFNDVIFLASTSTDGTSFEDIVAGTSGADTLSGFGEHDHLFGAAGNDILIGGGGEDFLQGGDGNDIFRFLDPSDGVSAEDGVFGLFDGDFVDDFASGVDKFQFDGTAFGFGAFTGTLTLNTNFFVEADFDGTSTGGGTPTGAYVVFDPNTFNLYTDAAQNDGGYTVVANLGATPVAGDIEII